jgi:hypothetical protein
MSELINRAYAWSFHLTTCRHHDRLLPERSRIQPLLNLGEPESRTPPILAAAAPQLELPREAFGAPPAEPIDLSPREAGHFGELFYRDQPGKRGLRICSSWHLHLGCLQCWSS